MKTVLLSLLVGLVGGFGGGWLYQSMYAGDSASSGSSSSSSVDSGSTTTLAECLTEVWGEDKYAAISANASLATTEDNFAALTCYEAK